MKATATLIESGRYRVVFDDGVTEEFTYKNATVFNSVGEKISSASNDRDKVGHAAVSYALGAWKRVNIAAREAEIAERPARLAWLEQAHQLIGYSEAEAIEAFRNGETPHEYVRRMLMAAQGECHGK